MEWLNSGVAPAEDDWMEPATIGAPAGATGGASLEEISRLHVECAMARSVSDVWEALLDAARRLAGAPYGFIAEVGTDSRGEPESRLLATRWVGGKELVSLHPDTEAAVRAVLRSGSVISMPGTRDPLRDSKSISPMSRLLVAPIVSGRFVGLVGLTGDPLLADPGLPDMLHPLLASGAAIIEARGTGGNGRADLEMASSLIESTPDLVAWATCDERLRYLNSGGRRLLGRTEDDAVDDLELASIIAESHRVAFVERVLPAAKSRGVWVGESEIETAAGKTIPVSLVVIAQGPADSAPFIAVLARDLSEREEVDRLKDAFVSNVSHELRTPLTSMIGFLELIADESLGPLTSEQRTLVGAIERNTETLRILISEILDVVTDWDQSQPGLAEVNLAAAASFEVNRVAFDARSRNITIDTDLDAGCRLVADKHAIHQAIAHLVQNAVKFGKDGGRITVCVKTEADHAVVEVTDDGIGVSEHETERVFDRFYRAENAQRLEIRGTGLGLPYVKRVAEIHGGSVAIRSKINEGATVTLRLPKAR